MPDNNKLIESVFEKGTLTIRLFGRIDSTNAAAAEEEILAAAQEPVFGTRTAHRGERADYTVCAQVRIRRHTSDSPDDAYCRYRRGDFLRSSRTSSAVRPGTLRQ